MINTWTEKITALALATILALSLTLYIKSAIETSQATKKSISIRQRLTMPKPL